MYITAPEFNELTAENFTARVKQANLTTKSNTAGVANETDFHDKLKKIKQIKENMQGLIMNGKNCKI